ncbi:ABC transporter ATP-binding protein [archaeon]|jgi:ABC-type multidrug transport system ATPase subunit|nr:ABC transporter ATP-binding protein [archaeon]MBT7128473.1 ABC transporter ATP-binding protein [archaeon]
MKFFNKLIKKQKPLTTSSVGFSYPNQEVLRDISLSIKSGELISIIGESGCGKSTLLKIIAGIISTSYQGKIKIFGKPKLFNKNKIGFTPQEVSLIPDLSILDNIKIFGLNSGITENQAIKKANELMQILKLEEDLNKLPSQISGGQRVRLNIILSLLHDPKILILDEPFAGLDFLNRRLLWHFLESLRKKGKSIILTSHLLTETQEHVDRLIILKKGKVFFSGNLEKLKAKLKINYIYEIRFTHLSKSNLKEIRKYCTYKDVKILDSYEKYLMFGINTERQKSYLLKLLQKLNLKWSEISFREPNLDETFLKA